MCSISKLDKESEVNLHLCATSTLYLGSYLIGIFRDYFQLLKDSSISVFCIMLERTLCYFKQMENEAVLADKRNNVGKEYEQNSNVNREDEREKSLYDVV